MRGSQAWRPVAHQRNIVRALRVKLPMRLAKIWTKEGEDLLRDLVSRGMTDQQIALRLRRNVPAVRERARSLGITLPKPKRLPNVERVSRLA